ncbi:MAG: hypothetical protein HFI71_07845 [Lachnospiraceae bacterium]|nr:hypothetical protein [Lachnospiraceae bacterium]
MSTSIVVSFVEADRAEMLCAIGIIISQIKSYHEERGDSRKKMNFNIILA